MSLIFLAILKWILQAPEILLINHFNLLLVPSQAPNIISTEHTSSRSIKVKWQTLADSFWNGVPLSYTVYFILKDTYDVSNTDRDVYFVNASYPATEVEVVELTPYKVYVIWMTASTVKGSGPNTTDYRQRTDSEGRPLMFYFRIFSESFCYLELLKGAQ